MAYTVMQCNDFPAFYSAQQTGGMGTSLPPLANLTQATPVTSASSPSGGMQLMPTSNTAVTASVTTTNSPKRSQTSSVSPPPQQTQSQPYNFYVQSPETVSFDTQGNHNISHESNSILIDC